MKLFFDGGCRPNPGPMEIAVMARGKLFVRRDIGDGSNNDAEWQALLYALEVAGELGAQDVQLLGDSATIVGQANGGKCRSAALRRYAALFAEAVRPFTRVSVRRISRSQNLAGIALDKARAGLAQAN